MKYRAKVTIEFDVTLPQRQPNEYDEDEVESAIRDRTEDAAVSLYDLIGAANAGHPTVDVELKPIAAKRRASKKRSSRR